MKNQDSPIPYVGGVKDDQPENIFSYPVQAEIMQMSPSGYLKPSGYQQMINKVVEDHLRTFNFGVESLFRYNLSWVLVSVTIQVIKPINKIDVYYGKTWHSAKKGVTYRREIELYDKDDNLICTAAMFTILFDISSRTIFTNKVLPFNLRPPIPQLSLDAVPSFKEKLSYTPVHTRPVYRSALDCLGHVNNCKYGDFAYDALDEAESEAKNIKRIELYFTSELTLGENFTANKSVTDSKVVIQGYNENQNKVAFTVSFSY